LSATQPSRCSARPRAARPGLGGGLRLVDGGDARRSQRAKASPELAEASALSICAASVVMSLRVLGSLAATNRELW